MNDTNWNRCPDTEDGQHRPRQGPHEPSLPPGYCNIECSACGQTTGIPIPPLNEIDWG